MYAHVGVFLSIVRFKLGGGVRMNCGNPAKGVWGKCMPSCPDAIVAFAESSAHIWDQQCEANQKCCNLNPTHSDEAEHLVLSSKPLPPVTSPDGLPHMEKQAQVRTKVDDIDLFAD